MTINDVTMLQQANETFRQSIVALEAAVHAALLIIDGIGADADSRELVIARWRTQIGKCFNVSSRTTRMSVHAPTMRTLAQRSTPYCPFGTGHVDTAGCARLARNDGFARWSVPEVRRSDARCRGRAVAPNIGRGCQRMAPATKVATM